jgi:hypothetical protein
VSEFLERRRDARDAAYQNRVKPPKPKHPKPPKKFPRGKKSTKPAKRLITSQERTARAIAADALWIADNWHDYRATVAATHPTVLRASAPRDGGRSTDHADPTSTLALTFTGGAIEDEDTHTRDRIDFDEVSEAIPAFHRQGQWIIDHMLTLLGTEGPASRDRSKLRCDGSFNPLCIEYQAPDRGGKCDTCYMADYRQRRKVASVETSSASVPASCHPSALEAPPTLVEATCGRCGRTFPARDSEHGRLLLEDHHNTGCPT